MIDPTYEDVVTVGGVLSSYRFNAFPQPTQALGGSDGLLSRQSFILSLRLEATSLTSFDIAGSTTTLYVSASGDDGYTPVILGTGVLSASGVHDGTTDTVTFTVAKDQIPNDLGSYGRTVNGNSKFYIILEDADSYLEFWEGVNVFDTQFGGTGGGTSSAITPVGNDLGTVISTLNTPPVSPATNDAYLVGTSPTGDWLTPTDLTNNLVIFNGAAWIALAPVDGNFVFDDNQGIQLLFDGTTWAGLDSAPFSDASALVKNDADNTKLIDFDASGITTGTTRTITMPDADVDLGDVAITNLSTTQTATTVDVVSSDGTDATLPQAIASGNAGVMSGADKALLDTALQAAAVGVYRDIYIDAAAMVPRTTNGAEALTKEFATNDIMIDYLAFDQATEEGAQFKMMMPDEWDRSTIKLKVFWDAAATASGTVIWGVKAGALSNDDAIDAALGTQVTVTDTLLAVGDMHISPATAAVTVGGTPALEDMIIFQIVATTGGTIAVDQFLMGISIQYKESTTTPVIW